MAGTHPFSRRRFLGGSAAALGGLSTGLFGESLLAQPKAPPLSLPLAQLTPTGALDEAYWWKVRSQFNVVDGLTFMNNGTYGPTPRVVVDAFRRYNDALAEDPTNNYWNEGRDAVRTRMAAFVGATADEIALTRSTSEGMNIFIKGLDWKAGDEVVFCTHEHGGGIQPLMQIEARYGVKLVRVEVPSPPESPEQIVKIFERAITAKTRLLMVSHMTYVTGLVTPIKALSDLAHSKGALISVDGAHPLGMLDLNLAATGIDHYAAAGQKWLLAGTGTGVCYIKRDVQDRIWPLMGYADLKTANDPKATQFGARKYELGGQRHVPSFMAMADAMDLHEAIGKKNVEARVRQLSTQASRRSQEHRRREDVDVGEPGAVGRPHALLGARPADGERGEGHLRPQPRVDPHHDDGQPERRARRHAHLQPARGSGSPARGRDARGEERGAVQDDERPRGSGLAASRYTSSTASATPLPCALTVALPQVRGNQFVVGFFSNAGQLRMTVMVGGRVPSAATFITNPLPSGATA